MNICRFDISSVKGLPAVRLWRVSKLRFSSAAEHSPSASNSLPPSPTKKSPAVVVEVKKIILQAEKVPSHHFSNGPSLRGTALLRDRNKRFTVASVKQEHFVLNSHDLQMEHAQVLKLIIQDMFYSEFLSGYGTHCSQLINRIALFRIPICEWNNLFHNW